MVGTTPTGCDLHEYIEKMVEAQANSITSLSKIIVGRWVFYLVLGIVATVIGATWFEIRAMRNEVIRKIEILDADTSIKRDMLMIKMDGLSDRLSRLEGRIDSYGSIKAR